MALPTITFSDDADVDSFATALAYHAYTFHLADGTTITGTPHGLDEVFSNRLKVVLYRDEFGNPIADERTVLLRVSQIIKAVYL